MHDKSQSTASAAPVLSTYSILTADQLKIEVAAFFKKLLVLCGKRSLLNKLKEMLQYGMATLLVGAIFLACSWLFLVQLAEYGWR